jgi:hypothetical protein
MDAVRTITSLPALLSSLSSLQAADASVSASLASLVSSEHKIAASLARLRALTPSIDELRFDATLLLNKVSTTAQTADRVGGRVKALDEEMRRIREAVETVAQVVELKVFYFQLDHACANAVSRLHWLLLATLLMPKTGSLRAGIALGPWLFLKTSFLVNSLSSL